MRKNYNKIWFKTKYIYPLIFSRVGSVMLNQISSVLMPQPNICSDIKGLQITGSQHGVQNMNTRVLTVQLERKIKVV